MLSEPISPLQVNVISLAVNHKNCGALGKKTDFLRTSQRGPQQPQQFQNRMNYSSQDAFQASKIRLVYKNPCHQKQSTRTTESRTREGRPVCDICGRVDQVRQNCYSRVDQRNQYQNPETTQPHPQSGVRIAALEAEDAAETGAAQFNHQEAPRVHSFFASSTQDKKITRGYDSGPTRKLAKPTMTFPPSNQLNQQQCEQEAQPGRVYYARRSNPPTLGSTEVPRISTIQAVQPINYNSVKKNEARARDILKTEFTESALN